jgi:hypothetical protein
MEETFCLNRLAKAELLELFRAMIHCADESLGALLFSFLFTPFN